MSREYLWKITLLGVQALSSFANGVSKNYLTNIWMVGYRILHEAIKMEESYPQPHTFLDKLNM